MDRLRLGMHTVHEQDMQVLVSTIVDVVVILVFITLGANLPWGDIRDNFWPALAVVIVLIVLARPLTVVLPRAGQARPVVAREIVFLLDS